MRKCQGDAYHQNIVIARKEAISCPKRHCEFKQFKNCWNIKWRPLCNPFLCSPTTVRSLEAWVLQWWRLRTITYWLCAFYKKSSLVGKRSDEAISFFSAAYSNILTQSICENLPYQCHLRSILLTAESLLESGIRILTSGFLLLNSVFCNSIITSVNHQII